jgi:hypothetical protein
MQSRHFPGRFLWIGLGFFLCLVFLPWHPAQGQQVHKNAFETLNTSWIKGGADVAFEEIAHIMSDQGAHDGRRSEFIKINAQASNPVQSPDTIPHIYYQYPTAQAPISIELSASIWLKANRPGPQLLARVVLPNERDPNNLDAHLTTLLRGDAYRTVGRWQRLDQGRLVQLAKKQQELMQAALKRPINFTGAYVDTLIVNLYGGPGPTEVWIDDLEIGPVVQGTAPPPIDRGGKTPGLPVSRGGPLPRPGQAVDFNGTQLLVGGKPFFFHGIRYTDTDLRTLRTTGFNSVFIDYKTDPNTLKEAVDLGFLLVPMLGVMTQDKRFGSADGLRQEMNRLSESEALLFWHLGGTLAFEQTARVGQIAQLMKNIDPGRPLGADVWDGLLPYSRSLQLLGIHRWPLMTTLEFPRYREWLDQRRRLANPGVFLWTWIQTHLPDWYTYLLYNQAGSSAFKEPIGPQAEQVRILTYTALGAGCRGLAFWSDRFLAESHQGQDRLLCLALLNQELDMLEPLLSSGDEHPQWIGTSSKDVQAAVLRTAKGILVLPIWQGAGSQFVPGQAAESKLTIVIPQVPQSYRAWEVTPADVRGLRAQRVMGGTKVTIPEFGVTSAIVFTSDFTSENSIVGRFQTQARSYRQQAAQWSYDMAQVEMKKVLGIEQQLEKQGHTLPDGKQLLEDAQSRLLTARRHWDNRLFNEAYLESQRALRPLRIMMRAQWDKAVSECLGPKKGLDSPVSSPFAVSFFTLPRHWEFMEQVAKSVPTGNVLPGGDFEVDPQHLQDSWRLEEPTLDEVEMLAQRVSEVRVPMTVKPNTDKPGNAKTPNAKPAGGDNQPSALAAQPKAESRLPNASTVEPPKQGKQCLMMEIKPKAGTIAPLALERTLLALTSPVVHLQPGTLVQVGGWIRIPKDITASADGALLYDSAGGEPLAIRLTTATPWKKFTLYRRVPDSGTMYVTLALTGLGAVYFDDVRIEPLAAGNQVAGAR